MDRCTYIGHQVECYVVNVLGATVLSRLLYFASHLSLSCFTVFMLVDFSDIDDTFHRYFVSKIFTLCYKNFEVEHGYEVALTLCIYRDYKIGAKKRLIFKFQKNTIFTKKIKINSFDMFHYSYL